MAELRPDGSINKLSHDDYICVLCGKSAKQKTFIHRNEDIAPQMQFHSECIKTKMENDGSPIDVLRLLNIPFRTEYWEQQSQKYNNNMRETFSAYIRIMGPKHQFPDFRSSNFESEDNEFFVTDKTLAKWGTGLETDDYKMLETSYENLVALKPPANALEEEKYIAAVLLQKRAKDSYIDPSVAGSALKAIQQASEDALKGIGLDSKALNNTNSDKWLGERIRDWEKEEPLPEMGLEFHDVDKIGRFLRKYVLTPLARNFGKASDKDIQDMNIFSKDDIPGRNITWDDVKARQQEEKYNVDSDLMPDDIDPDDNWDDDFNG